jgi:hypothetical protein
MKEATAMDILKALGIGAAVYIGMVLSVVLLPVLFLLFFWIGACAFSATFLFFFWLLITHNPHTLYSSLYMLAWGTVPMMPASLLGFYCGKLGGRRRVPMVTLRQDVPFR